MTLVRYEPRPAPPLPEMLLPIVGLDHFEDRLSNKLVAVVMPGGPVPTGHPFDTFR